MSYFDTSKDFRILIAEQAFSELEKIFNAVKIQRRKDYIRRIRELSSEIQTLKYSYMPLSELEKLESLKKIVESAREIRTDLKKIERDLAVIQASYWLEYLENLPELFKRGELDRAYKAIRYFCGEIVSRTKTDGLWLCTVDCGFRMNIVTNSEKFKPGLFAVIAYLPPRVFGKHISEGMFVQLSERECRRELSMDEIEVLEAREVEATVFSLIG
jgi:hypothetical protein